MLPIKEENKFFSRHLTKESSISNPSFRVYYGGNSVAVPFVWEAKPGTPKHTKHNFSHEQQNKQLFPPLTPPPSYYLKQPQNLPNKKSFGKNFLDLFPKSMHRRKTSSASTLSCPSSSMLLDSTIRGSERSSSLRSSLGLSLSRGRRRAKSNSGSLFDFMMNSQEDDDEEIDVRSPRSILCFGFAGSRRIRSCTIADH